MLIARSLFYFAFVLLCSELTLAGNTDSKLYLVEPMECHAQLTSVNPGMHPAFITKKLVLTSFLAKLKDGSLANSLEITSTFTSKFYTGPMVIYGNSIKANLSETEILDLKVILSKPVGGVRVDVLQGTLINLNTAVGRTIYAVSCHANVINQATRIIDFKFKRYR